MTLAHVHHDAATARWRPGARRGFTLVELIVAAVIVALIAGGTTLITFRLLRTRGSAGAAEAFARANMAAMLIAQDLANTARDEDLAHARLALTPGGSDAASARDQLLVQIAGVRPVRAASPQNEGPVHTVQYRLDPDPSAPGTLALWRRADALPNTNLEGGGMAVPIAPGVVALQFEALDVEEWVEDWDSDVDGYPHAVRVTVTATDSAGERRASVRRVVALDRTPLPLVTTTSSDGTTTSTANGSGAAGSSSSGGGR